MKTFKLQYDCGCCFAETAQFESIETAQVALQKAGLGNGKTITDDAGNVFTGVDTFYGVMEMDEDTSRPLERLLGKVIQMERGE